MSNLKVFFAINSSRNPKIVTFYIELHWKKKLKSGQFLKIGTNLVQIQDSGLGAKFGTVQTKSGHMAGLVY